VDRPEDLLDAAALIKSVVERGLVPRITAAEWLGLAARLRTAAESHLSHPPSGFHEWLERRVALADAAMVAAQAVIGQCDCGMDEPPPNPKKAWHAARDAYWARPSIGGDAWLNTR
jgi:hypothetical protein